MKRKIQNMIKMSFASIAFLTASSVAHSATFTAIASGAWSSTTTWSGGVAPSASISADQISIPSGISVTMDNNTDINGALASIDVQGTLSSSTNSLTIGTGTLSGNGTIAISDLMLNTGALFTFSGTVAVNTLTTATGVTISTGADILIAQTLTLSSGSLVLDLGGSLDLAPNADIVVAGGLFSLSGGSIGLTNPYNVIYTSGSVTAGTELSGPGLKNLTIDVSAGNTVSLVSDLSIEGTLTLTTGTLALGSNSFVINNGDIAAGGSGYISSSSNSNITINSTTDISGKLFFNGTGNAVHDLTINVGDGNQMHINGELTIDGTLNLASGSLTFNYTNLTINGPVIGSGYLNGFLAANLNITTPGGVASPLNFVYTTKLNNLTVNVGTGNTVMLGTDLIVDSTLKFTSGSINIGDFGLTVDSTGYIIGADSIAYVITGDNGFLSMNLVAGASASMFPVGTLEHYMPANIQLNTGTPNGHISLNATNNVWDLGTSGTDLSITQPLVDGTWHVRTPDILTGLNLNLEVMWSVSMEVNAFDRTHARLSHFTSSSWDVSAVAAATLNANGMFSLQRNNITSLSPFAVFGEDATTGIEESSQDNSDFLIYPNPANDIITIKNNHVSNDDIYVDVTTVTGVVVRSLIITSTEMNVSLNGLSKGLYLVRIYNQNFNEIKRINKL